MIHSLSERHLLPMATPATLLRCIGWVDLDQLSASTFRLARQLSKERRPRCITDRFRQTMSMNHPVHVQVFNADDTELIDNLSALLMGEVLSPPRDTLMHTSNDFAMLASLRCAFSKFGVFTLDFSKRLFFLAEKRGFSISCPSESVAKVFKPTSIPTVSTFSGKHSGSTSQEKEAYYLPVFLLWMVSVLILPCTGRW